MLRDGTAKNLRAPVSIRHNQETKIKNFKLVRRKEVFDMKKIFLPLLLIILLITGCGNDSQKDDKLIIGIDDEFAPMGFRNEKNELVGFDIDLAKEAAKRLDVKIEFKPIDWDKKREEITSGNVDMIWNGLDITDERKQYMIFTKPYMDDRQILLVRKDDTQGILTEGDIEGKIVGVQAGSTSDCYINQNEELRNSLRDFKTYEKFNDAIEALSNAEIDIFVCDEMVARYEMNNHPDEFEIVDVKIGEITETAVGFRKDDTELRDKVQAAFDEMIRDGTAKKISEKWFNADLIKSNI